MSSRSASQQRLFAAAEHGADFPLARKLRASMTHQQLRDFAMTKTKGLPEYVHHSAPVTTGASDPVVDRQFLRDHGVSQMSHQQLQQLGRSLMGEDEPRRRNVTGYERKWVLEPGRKLEDV